MRPRRDGSAPDEVSKRNLTELHVRNVKPVPDRVVRIYDTKQRGLVLQVQPTGHAAWKAYYSHHGRPRWFHIGRTDAIALADARRLAANIMYQVAQGLDPQAERAAQREAGSFKELAEEYLEQCTNKSKFQYVRQLNAHALPLWGNLPAEGVRRDDVEALFNRRKRASVASAKLLLASISAVFTYAMGAPHWRGRITANPCADVGSVKRDKSLKMVSRTRVLTDAEIPAFWKAWEAAGFERCSALRLLLLTGQRPGEIANMHLEHVDAGEHHFDRATPDGGVVTELHKGAWWNFPGQPVSEWPGTKNAQDHRVWLTPAALAIVREIADGRTSGALFTKAGGMTDAMSRAMMSACAELHAERATPHDLRRTHGTMTTRLGFTRDAMNRIQNHREGGIGSVYDQHEYASEARAVQAAIGARIERLLTGADAKVTELPVRRRI